jgi:hypothetical protein
LDSGGKFRVADGVREVKLSKRSQKYLSNILNRIAQDNELILNPKTSSRIHIIKSKYPYYFSTPGGRVFFSSKLINSYIKNEQFLVSILAYELIRSHKGLYLKRMIVPTGDITEQRILHLTSVPLSVRLEASKWAYVAMRRSGFDSTACLTWIQILNRNSMDFIMQYSDPRDTIRLESMFKSFIISEGGQRKGDGILKEYNSPKDFYSFRKEVARKG